MNRIGDRKGACVGPLLGGNEDTGGENASSGAVADSDVRDDASSELASFFGIPRPELEPQSEERLGGVEEGEAGSMGSLKPTTFWAFNANNEGCCWNVVVLMFVGDGENQIESMMVNSSNV